MPEMIREADIIEMKEVPEVPHALMRWINRNRVIIQRLLDRSAGDVPLKISTAAMKSCDLDHQWVRIGQQSPHVIRSGEKLLTDLETVKALPAAHAPSDEIANDDDLAYAKAS